jgi:hypothetical protein
VSLGTREKSPTGTGCLTTTVTSLLTLVLTFALATVVVNRLVAQRHIDRPDFRTNGLNWLFAGIGVVDLLLAPLYLLVVYCVVLPLMYRAAKKSHTRRLNPHLITAGVLLPQIAFLSLFLASPSGDDAMNGAVLVGPLLLLTVVATYWLVKRLNAELSRLHS